MVTTAFQTKNSVGLNKAVYCRMLALAPSGRMKNRRPAPERERPGHHVQLRRREHLHHRREPPLDLLEQV
jgi:hypothetical protein